MKLTLKMARPDPARWSDTLARAIEDAAHSRAMASTLLPLKSGIALTPRDVEEKILLAALQRIDCGRCDRDPNDLFDKDGAVASLILLYNVLGRPPHDDVADLEARIAALGVDSTETLEDAVSAVNAAVAAEQQVSLPDEKAMKAAVKKAAQRIGYTTHVAAAWARDGLYTYDLTRGLYDLVTRTEDDATAAGMCPSLPWKRPAFAVRFPGPDYPRVVDPGAGPYEVRGAVVAQYADVASQEAFNILRENMLIASEGQEDDDPFTFRKLVDVFYPAARTAIPARPIHSFVMAFCGFRDGRPVGSTLENGFLRVRALDPTVRETVVAAAEEAADAADDKPNYDAYRRILNVVFGTALWLTYSEDEGVPQKARPVRVRNLPGLAANAVTPHAYVLGKGVKEARTG